MWNEESHRVDVSFSTDRAGFTLEPGGSLWSLPCSLPLPPGREGTGPGNTQPFSTGLKTGNIDPHTRGEFQRWGDSGSRKVNGARGRCIK